MMMKGILHTVLLILVGMHVIIVVLYIFIKLWMLCYLRIINDFI